MNFDPGKDKDINASFFLHELLNKPNWRLEFQVSNSKFLDLFLKRKYEPVSKKNNNDNKTGQITLSVYRTNDDIPRNK